MRLQRLDDYQGWRVEHDGISILIDPWLTPHPIAGAFNRNPPSTSAHVETPHAIVLCTHVNDHLHAETLRLFPQVNVHGPVKAAKIARSLGCTATHVCAPGQTFVVENRLRVTAVRGGLPLGLIANGYVIESLDADGQSHNRIWIEPHQPTAKVARAMGNVDIALVPNQSVTALVLPVTAGYKKSLAAAKACRATHVVATATDPRRDMSAWQRRVYFVGKSSSAVRELATGEYLDI